MVRAADRADELRQWEQGMASEGASSVLVPSGDVVGSWRDRMNLIVQTVREMSRQTDPQAMVRAYGARVRQLLPMDRMVGLSRRDLERPKYRVTRTDLWKDEINPWTNQESLPVLEGGLLGDLIYGDEPRIIDDIRLEKGDPGEKYFAGQRSLVAVPLYQKGVALNMVIWMRRQPEAFDRERFPEWVWLSNLFGQATHNLVLSAKLQEAYDVVDREMKVIAEIQRSLLPAELPRIPTMDLAAHYQTARVAGGDYYDFFELPGGQWGILIADVSGHGTPAAVLMAITHSIAHIFPGTSAPPGDMLRHINHHLASRYTATAGTFVTAFYGVYDPGRRRLSYACAGHNPPRLKRCSDGSLVILDAVNGYPLGILLDEPYKAAELALQPGDQVIFYTDGITEAANPHGEMFGVERLDQVLAKCPHTAADLLEAVLQELDRFAAGRPAGDDRTMLVARIH
jgi:sigma-B regulation protein RsbU (phosphoserine phosphatase)